MPVKVRLLSTKPWLCGPFIRNSISAMADSNLSAFVIRLQKEKRVVTLPRLKLLDKNLSFQEVFTNISYEDLDVRVKYRVGFKKPGNTQLKDFISVDLAENVGTIVNALGENFVDIDVLGKE